MMLIGRHRLARPQSAIPSMSIFPPKMAGQLGKCRIRKPVPFERGTEAALPEGNDMQAQGAAVRPLGRQEYQMSVPALVHSGALREAAFDQPP